MNGSKSTFKRKGYWLTAFAAAVLLAASPGTARRRSTTGPSTNGLKVEGDRRRSPCVKAKVDSRVRRQRHDANE